ncbi:sensor histidine kinase [Butyrivibrio sp. CB08]|uniref:sensor histidine kinase n=1 Tax=Butyrivibrio sp. CB08 TaxID=2364879 RepID=UPI000EAA9251|nr:sensor histidine kinase [Butyrivibrio sp. CB08]RKM58841.1 sensor histidine kinase [Butyrivibrio sp. CB08]
MGFVRQSFKRQMFITFLTVTLILVIGGGILTVQGLQARIRADYELRDSRQVAMVEERISGILQDTEDTIDRIAHNEAIADSFSKGRKNSLNIYNALYEETRQIREFAVVDLYLGGLCMYSTRSGYKSAELPLYYSVLKEAQDNEGKVVYTLDPGEASGDGASLLAAKQVVKGQTPGFVVIRIQQDELESQLKELLNANDGFMLTNQYLRPFCLIGSAKDKSALNIIRSNLFGGQLYNNGFDSNVYINEIGDTGLLGIYITPPALDETAVRAGYQIIIFLAVASVLICLLLANRFSNYVAKPINVLNQGMNRFRKGDFDAKIELAREDEFKQLAVGFNKMTTQLKDTMEERVQAERKVNETRIKMMQAQLNPHFLYNTLDTIKWVAKANQVPEVATMSSSLAGILRTSISEKQFCKLNEELKLIENYCDIQRIRFDDKFDITIDVPAEVREAVIPKLILQPIVENAIIHGMDEMDNGHIYIAALRQNQDGKDLLKISVQDDGKGISDEMLNALNTDDAKTLEGHLGLNNVNTIIRLYYGKEYGVLAIRPTEGGTVMIVTLPYSESAPTGE